MTLIEALQARSIPVVVVASHTDIRRLGDSMKSSALQEFETEPPVYSASAAEATARTQANIAVRGVESVVRGHVGQHLAFPSPTYLGGYAFVSMALSVDAYEAEKRWHLSLGLLRIRKAASGDGLLVGGIEPDRVTDPMANRILRAILPEAEEGPAEGAYKNVRHFFLDYRAP